MTSGGGTGTGGGREIPRCGLCSLTEVGDGDMDLDKKVQELRVEVRSIRDQIARLRALVADMKKVYEVKAARISRPCGNPNCSLCKRVL